MIKKLFDFKTEIQDNLNLEMLCFTGQRVSGIALALYLLPHIFVASTATLFGPDYFTWLMKQMHSLPVLIAEILLFMAVFAHMLNGLRVTICDFFALTKEQRKIIFIIAFIGVVVVLIGGSMIVFNFLKLLHNA